MPGPGLRPPNELVLSNENPYHTKMQATAIRLRAESARRPVPDLPRGLESGNIDLDWFISPGFGIDSYNTGQHGLPPDHPFILNHQRPDRPNTYFQCTSETSYNGDLIVRLRFGDRSIIAAVMPHAQSVGAGMNRYTDPMRASLIHRALDGQLLSDFSEFKHNTFTVAGLDE